LNPNSSDTFRRINVCLSLSFASFWISNIFSNDKSSYSGSHGPRRLRDELCSDRGYQPHECFFKI
jgi:hypothetical protein